MTSATPRDILRRLSGTPLVIMLDIDGTLCEIVERPGDADVPANATASLRQLAAVTDGSVQVAFITGRSVHDAYQMLGVQCATIYGNHGMERMSASGNIRGPEGWEDDEPALRDAAREFVSLIREFPGSHVEDKCFSLTIHYRGIDMSRFPELYARAREIADRWSLRVSAGKRVLNVVPRGAVNKGDAVLDVMGDIGSAATQASILFVGDDVTDEDGFVVLAAVPMAVTVRVGGADAESAAKFSFDSPTQVHELLALIVEART